MTIKEAAKKLHVETHVLRYWENELQLDIKRNAQGHRYYDERDIRMFESVKAMKEEGLTLKDIRDAIIRAKRAMKEHADVGAEQEKPRKQEDTEAESEEVRKRADAETGAGEDPVLMEKPEPDEDGRTTKHQAQRYNMKSVDETTGKENAVELQPVHTRIDEDKDSMLERMEKAVAENDPKVVDFKQAQLQSVMNRVIATALRENKDIITSSIKEEVTADVMRQFDAVMREKEEREEARYRRLDDVLREIRQANAEAAATKVRRGLWKKRR